MEQKLAEFLFDEGGATVIEYGLIAALVSVAGIATLTQMGESLSLIFNRVSSLLTSAAS